MVDELEDAAISEEVPEWSPEEPTPESTEEVTEFYESDPEEDEDYSPTLAEVCRAELAAITAKVLTPRQHEAFYLAHTFMSSFPQRTRPLMFPVLRAPKRLPRF